MMNKRIGAALLCAAISSGISAGGAQAQATLRAADVPGLVVQARNGNDTAARRLESWIGAARSGDRAALDIVADVVNDGIVADRQLFDDLERQAAAGGWDAGTAYVRSVISGTGHVTVAKSAEALAATGNQPAVDAAYALANIAEADLNGRVLLATFDPPELDPEDVTNVVESDDAEISSVSGGTKTACKPVNYYDAITGLTMMGMEVCITWKYDGRRYVSNGTRSITPYVSVVGTAHRWRWVGTSLAEKYYYNYGGRGPKSGFHTKTIGHFQHCLSQEVLAICDQDEFPTIILDGNYKGTSSSKTKP